MTASRLRVLLIAPTCDGGDVGEAWVAYQWAKHLANRHDVTLLTYHKRGAKPASSQLSGLRIVEWQEMPLIGRAERLNSIAKPGYIPFYFQARRWIKRALRNGERFDIAHQPVPVAMRYPCPAAGLGIPFIVGPVGGGLDSPAGFAGDDASTPWFMRLRALDEFRRRYDPMLTGTYRQAGCVLGIAPYVAQILSSINMKRFEIMSETGLESVPAPIDRKNRSDPVRLLYVGRLVRTKGARDAIRAMALCRDLPVVLDVVGDGPERRICSELVASLDLADRVTLHGWKPKSEVGRFYSAADVFVFPSYREPGGNVAPEAMAHSLPLIVADRGGPGSAVSDSCAIRLPVTSPDQLAQDVAAAIKDLAQSRECRLRMGAAAYEHVKKTALWPAKIERIGQIYREVAATHGSNIAQISGA